MRITIDCIVSFIQMPKHTQAQWPSLLNECMQSNPKEKRESWFMLNFCIFSLFFLFNKTSISFHLIWVSKNKIKCASPFRFNATLWLVCVFFVLQPTIKQHVMHLVLAITSIYLCTPFNRFICIANRYHVHHYPWALIYFIRFRHLSFAFSLMPLLVCNSDCNAIKMHPNKNRDNVSLIC